MKLSIVIPAKNEESRLPATLASLCRHIARNYNLLRTEVEVIVVVNNSTDATYEIVKIFQKHFTFIRVYNINEYVGKGGAIRFGFEKALGESIAFIDADGSSSSHELFKLYHNMILSKSDIAIANRYIEGSTIIRQLPYTRVFFSKGFRIISTLMFGLKYKDTQCGLKVFKRDIGKYLMKNNQVKGWTFDLNILIMAKILGLKVFDMPTVWEYKPGSTLNIKSAIKSVTMELFTSFMKYRVPGAKGRLEFKAQV